MRKPIIGRPSCTQVPTVGKPAVYKARPTMPMLAATAQQQPQSQWRDRSASAAEALDWTLHSCKRAATGQPLTCEWRYVSEHQAE